VALGTAFWINTVRRVATAYLALMTAYTFWAKHVVILDVLALAAGSCCARRPAPPRST
jgi:4-hydroxybenzoate polyprenyltransferase